MTCWILRRTCKNSPPRRTITARASPPSASSASPTSPATDRHHAGILNHRDTEDTERGRRRNHGILIRSLSSLPFLPLRALCVSVVQIASVAGVDDEGVGGTVGGFFGPGGDLLRADVVRGEAHAEG